MARQVSREIEDKIAAIGQEMDERRDGGDEADAPLYRRARKQTFALRLPDERIDQLRRVARAQGVPPTALARRWLLERLDAEDHGEGEPDSRIRRAVRAELERAGLVKEHAMT